MRLRSITARFSVRVYRPQATNIAETSITINGIRYVVDSGKVKVSPPPPSIRTCFLRPSNNSYITFLHPSNNSYMSIISLQLLHSFPTSFLQLLHSHAPYPQLLHYTFPSRHIVFRPSYNSYIPSSFLQLLHSYMLPTTPTILLKPSSYNSYIPTSFPKFLHPSYNSYIPTSSLQLIHPYYISYAPTWFLQLLHSCTLSPSNTWKDSISFLSSGFRLGDTPHAM